jgi:hypothetical protein
MRDYTIADISKLAMADVHLLERKDAEYGRSWRRRGGHSACENVMRKVDRLTTQLEKHGWDIFAALLEEGNTERLLDTIHDLRGYLYLVEAHLMAEGKLTPPATTPLETDASIYTVPLRPTDVPISSVNVHVDRSGQQHPFGYDPQEEQQ